jgi:hypothetical protein
MKIKQDFVTNSSSTSYVICFPKNFDALKFLEENKENITDELEDNEFTYDQFKDVLDDFIKSKVLYLDNSCESYYILEELFKDFIICSSDVSSDSGVIDLVYLEDIIKQITNPNINKYSKPERFDPIKLPINKPYGDKT